MDNRKVAVIVGSLRRGSFSRMVANAMCGLHSDLDCAIVEIGKLPLYNPDREEEGPPREWIDFREQVRSRDAVLFVTPEYNRSLPGNLKNAIDVGSRPYGQSVWSKKPAAIVSVSPGALGAFGANHHLRQCLVFLDMPTLQQPEAYVGAISSKLDSDGSLANADTREFLAKYMEAFARWIQMTGTHPGDAPRL
jgi:chromate reductase